ncbi:MAG TPA: helix-turn-helix domain-containing protein [Rhizomicrobium sp.]|nr:helix-turn-helix domain-containing protein [Rhizomicrobium sp.]
MEKERRRYGGASFEDRLSERRERLIRAAVEVFGRAGRDGATVAAICAQAGLTARYFYESFPSRDALFLEAYRLVQRELLAEIERNRDAENPVRGALTAFYAGLAAHPGLARVFLLDPHGRETAMQDAGRETATRLVKLFAPKVQTHLAAAGMLGAVVDIARRWIESDFAEPVETVVATALPFAQAAAGN